MIVEPFFLLRILSRLFRNRRAIHPMPQEEREQPSTLKDDATATCGWETDGSFSDTDSDNECDSLIYRWESDLCLPQSCASEQEPASHDDSVISRKHGIQTGSKVVRSPTPSTLQTKNDSLVGFSLSMECKRQIDTFCIKKSLIEGEFYAHEFGSDNKKRGWKNLFRELEVSLEFTGSELELHYDAECLDRNRYRTILPYKQTRVKLSNTENDYINASFVTMEEVSRSYIVTQGPLENTVGHFWQMIWEQQSVGIVMLCKCVEEDRNKCTHYWPAVGESPMITGCYVVECISFDRNGSYCLSSLKLHNLDTEESRTVLHYHYYAWPDFGVPQDPMMFLEFLIDVRRSGVMQPGVGPVVVHCSAGIGRSGVFSLIDVCVSWLEEAGGLDTLDVKALLLRMRKQRLGLIQTPEQLRFSYMAVLNAAHHVLGLVKSIPDLQKEVDSFTEAVIVAEQERYKAKCVGASPPPEKAQALQLPPQMSSCVLHCSSAPASHLCSPPRLHHPSTSIPAFSPLSPTPPPTLSPDSPIPPPTLSPDSPIPPPTLSPHSPTPPPTLSPPPPTLPPSSESSLPPPSPPRFTSSPFPPSSPPPLLGSQFSTNHPAVVESECESVVKTKKRRSWFKRLKQRLIQRKRKRTRE